MQNLSNIELQNLRHLIVEEQVKASKSKFYAQQVSNPQLSSFLDKKAHSCEQNVQKLSQFITI